MLRNALVAAAWSAVAAHSS
ncbi:hypothetical protein [Microbispora siamensis]